MMIEQSNNNTSIIVVYNNACSSFFIYFYFTGRDSADKLSKSHIYCWYNENEFLYVRSAVVAMVYVPRREWENFF